jgi:hypothetical protein
METCSKKASQGLGRILLIPSYIDNISCQSQSYKLHEFTLNQKFKIEVISI